MKLFKSWQILFACVVLMGCTRTCGPSHADLSPEEVVEAYLDIALNMTSVDDKVNLMRYTTGQLRYAIETATDEAIINAYIKRKYKLLAYSVVERRDRRPKEVEITFELTYKDLNDFDENQNSVTISEDEAATTKTENTVRVIKQNDVWLISDVVGKKTTIDFPVRPQDVIKSGAP